MLYFTSPEKEFFYIYEVITWGGEKAPLTTTHVHLSLSRARAHVHTHTQTDAVYTNVS